MLAPLLLTLLLVTPQDPEPKPPADSFQPDPSWRKLGEAVWFDPKNRRAILRARVALTDGPLEHLLCLENTKEHESILATAAPPRAIQAALLLTGAKPGHPARFHPKFEPPTGTPMSITLEWTEKGQTRRADAKQWVKDEKTGQPLATNWVFAGSELFRDPETGRTIFAADGGDLFTVSNFVGSILDLPFASTAEDAGRTFAANTPRIPPRGTPVTLYVQPADAQPPAAKPAPRP